MQTFLTHCVLGSAFGCTLKLMDYTLTLNDYSYPQSPPPLTPHFFVKAAIIGGIWLSVSKFIVKVYSERYYKDFGMVNILKEQKDNIPNHYGKFRSDQIASVERDKIKLIFSLIFLLGGTWLVNRSKVFDNSKIFYIILIPNLVSFANNYFNIRNKSYLYNDNYNYIDH